MGVHYFYTWVTRRYPLFKKLYDPEIIPAIDNFFIDLNGVLYRCAKDDKALFRDILKGKNFGEIFAAIFNYINFLVNHTRPRKRIYIAIDGVAPRAKMNNQRQRRYHSARANKSLNDFLTDELQTDPGVVSFKNNSISPGTDFMMDLIDHVKFFVQRKIHEDDNWKGIEVIFSGGDIPGEGEHKIMDWLRGWKQSPDYDINESHCIYSNDADLIFLGLSLHLPKMLILREVHKFSDNPVNSATKRTSEEPQIELLFINLLREYMELEYNKDKDRYNHQFDIERVIDDFILIAYFIGNDFLHQLYCMSTKKGNFDEMIEIFKTTLPGLGGYLSDKGRINWPNFAKFLQKIMPLEIKMIETTLEQMREYLEETKKSKQSLFNDTRDHDNRHNEDEEDDMTVTKNSSTAGDGADDEEEETKKKPRTVTAPADDDEDEDSEEHDFHEDLKAQVHQDDALKKLDKNYELEYQLNYTKIKNEVSFISDMLGGLKSQDPKVQAQKKLLFYKKFFKLDSLEHVDNVCLDYMKGMQFVMHYYFHGCPSWSYYYPYFMSPFLSDLITVVNKHAANVQITFDREGPYKPFDQLAYILPRASMGLLPDEYSRVLLSDPRTEKYYPARMEDFEPFDGIHDYQWIAKLELFNDPEMQEVLKKIDYSKFTPKEKRRNSQGVPQIYRYNKKAPAVHVKSIIQGLNDFTEHLEIVEIDLDKQYPFNESKIEYDLKGLNPNDGFPSLKIVPGVTGQLAAINKKAKYRKFVLTINPDAVDPQRKRNGLSGFVFFDYPFRKIGYVNTEVTAEGSYSNGNLESKIVSDIAYQRNVAPNRLYDVYKAVSDDSTSLLYREKGIDFNVRGDRESYYELEYRKSAWRTILDTNRKVVYEYDYVQEVYPHGLLVPFDLKVYEECQTQLKFPKNEDELFKSGNSAVNLYNGDIFTIKDKSKSNITVSGVITKPNPNPSRQVIEQRKLLDQHWRLIDNSFLKELGLKESEILVLYGIMDSFVIRTDSSKTSSLILGQMFDIGLRMFKALGMFESKLQIVADLVK